jgi:cell division protein FtsQ
MNLALLEEKNLVNVWKKNGSYQRKAGNGNSFFWKKLKKKETSLDLGSFFITLINWLAKIVLVVVCFYGILSSYRFITQSPHFNINEINLVGHKRLSSEELSSWTGTIIGKNIFKLELDGISKRLVEHPWIQSASARRILPQGIYVEIQERTPFAKIEMERVYVMDNYGVLLGLDLRGANKLPTITGMKIKNPKIGSNVADEEIIRGLKMMHSLNQLSMFEKNPIDNVHISSRYRITFSTNAQDIKVHMRPEIAQESFKNLVLALGAIEKNDKDLSYIDLSFKNKVVVKNRYEVKREF